MTARGERMRILITSDAIGGVWQYAADLARALGALDVETVLAVLGPAPSPEQRDAARAIAGVTLVETGLPLDWLAQDREQVLLAGRRIAELARHTNVDIIQLNQPAYAADGHFHVPVVAVSHSCLATWWDAVEAGPLPSDFTWRVALHGAGLQAADRVITPSVAFADATRCAYDLIEKPKVVHNGRSKLLQPATAMHDFGFTAGRLWDRGKNLATLDRAAARLAVPVKAAGSIDGPHGEHIALDNVFVLGRMSDEGLAGHLAARPVFVSTSLYEPFGLAVLEAAMAGCALVLADIPTFRELWEEVAIFVDPQDDRGFADAVEHLIRDTALRLEQGEKARTVARRYTPERMATEMLGIYRELLPAIRERGIAA